MPATPIPWSSLQLPHDLRGTEAAVALAGDEFRRFEAIVRLDPAAHGDGKRLDIAVDAVERAAHVVAAEDAAIAGAGGIDEDEIGEIEPGVGIVDRHRRCRRPVGLPRHRQPPRPEPAEVEPARGIARPAVEHESHRPRARIGAVEREGERGDIGLRRAAVGIEQADRAGGRGKMQRAIGQLQHVMGHRRGRQRRQLAGAGRRSAPLPPRALLLRPCCGPPGPRPGACAPAMPP